MREWCGMTKDIKKFYHDIANQEKKKQKKLNKEKEAEGETNSLSKNQSTLF
jgi:hypothetical protein